MLSSSHPNFKLSQYLESSFKKGTVFHAYLFCGPSESGKFDLAVEFASLINKTDPEKILKGVDPDVLVVNLEKTTAKKTENGTKEEGETSFRKKNSLIGEVRKVIARASVKVEKGKKNILIIKNVQNLSENSSNALLKSIEEPPRGAIFILISNTEEKVLPTIRSRCRIIRFRLLENQELANYLEESYNQSKEQALEIAQLAMGRVKLAERLVTDEGIRKELRQIQKSFRDALRGGLLEGLSLAQEVSRSRENAQKNIQLWVWFLRDYLIKTATFQNQPSSWKIEKKILKMISSLEEIRQKIENTNTNQRAQVEKFFITESF